MRVAAVALVLIVGAAVVLAFANTLNSWVLGGLLGGLAAILISVPISLALFTLLARRQDARQTAVEVSAPTMDELPDEFYEDQMVYEAEGYVFFDEQDAFAANPSTSFYPEQRRAPVSGYLDLPPSDEEDFLEDQRSNREDVRSYPRQPREAIRSQYRERNLAPPPQTTQHPTQQSPEVRRKQSTLSQHQSAALQKARREAQQQQRDAEAPSRRPTGKRSTTPSRRPQTTHNARPSAPTTTGVQRPVDGQRAWLAHQERVWRSLDDDEAFDEERDTSTQESEQRRPRPVRQQRPSRATRPHSTQSENDETGKLDNRRSRREPETIRRHTLTRRAPYLYDDDPLREELAQQLGNNQPTTRRSSRTEDYDDNDEY